MKFWITKENDMLPPEGWKGSFVFSVNRDSGSTLFSSLQKIWYHLGQLSIQPLYEDLFIIALSIFGLDKRVPRSLFQDNWTREIDVSIPILQYEEWKSTEESWNKMLAFLTGDKWQISFRPTTVISSQRTRASRTKIDISRCDAVCLFSGGLDSFCGAIKLLDSGLSPCLVGHNEYPKLRAKQESFAASFCEYYPEQTTRFIGFTAGSRAPISEQSGKPLAGAENTSRGRSLLFLSCAVTIAGIIGPATTVYIPENGFIGVNVPLTGSRIGSCTTRTTHPFFIKQFQDILHHVGIVHPIINPFSYYTKREIVRMVKDNPAFLAGYSETISCSHPCVSRYYRDGSREYPINCGYCYPCLIRKSSLLDVVGVNKYSFEGLPSAFISEHSNSDKSQDLIAVLNSVYLYKHSSSADIRRRINNTGPMSVEEVDKYERLYISGMNDLVELFCKDPEMEKYC